MVSIKKQKVSGYILLESLVGLALLVAIVSLLLGEFNYRQQRIREYLKQEEALNVAIMAVQTKQDNLSLNDVTVSVQRHSNGITVYQDGKELLDVKKD